MENEKIYTIEEIKQKTESIFKKYNIEKAYLFGSYARGEATKNSDIDIMILGGKQDLLEIGGINLELEKILNKKIDIIQEEIYTVPLYQEKYDEYDYYDFLRKKENQKIKENIFKERILIYE